ALNILRETILGRELFDFAFKQYALRWKFKRPTPSDFFRTMEDASGIDLDWFWRGWFYSTDHVDLAIEDVKLFIVDQGDPDEAAERNRKEREEKDPSISQQRNQELPKRIDWQPGLKDFYNSPDYDEFAVEESARKAYQKMLEELDDEQRSLLQRTTNFYVVKFRNHGGLVMPIIVRLHYADSTSEIVRVPVDIWRSNGDVVEKLFVSEKEVVRMELDPFRETADTETSNNHWPPRLIPSRFKLYKSKSGDNEMRRAKKKKEAAEKKEAEEQKESENQANSKEGGDSGKDSPTKAEGNQPDTAE
ncbi:MAG: aminopeptidase, partial [Planctomycetota bacterium]|nr:aminopeptidase [Planctomycetota bacterium]